MSRRRGRPRYKDENQLRERILNLIPEDDKGIRWIDLERKARSLGISLSTVRKYLARLEAGRTVERRVDQDARPPAVYYVRIHDRHFRGVTPVAAASVPTIQEWMKEWCPGTLESFSDFNNALSESLGKLHEIRTFEKVEDEQGRLFLFYGNVFLGILSNILTDYSDIGPSEEAESFFHEALDTLVAPLLSRMAKIADPKFGRCKYAMEDARQALFDTLPAQLKHYKQARTSLRERVKSLRRQKKNP